MKNHTDKIFANRRDFKKNSFPILKEIRMVTKTYIRYVFISPRGSHLIYSCSRGSQLGLRESIKYFNI